MRVTGIATTVEGGTLLVDDLVLAHPAQASLFRDSGCGEPLPGGFLSAGESALIRVTGNASHGGFTLSVVRGDAPGEIWGIE